MPRNQTDTVRKIIAFDRPTWQALELLGRDSMKSLQELMDEAAWDLLRKHNRPVTLGEALTASARALPANDAQPRPLRRTPRSRT
ncbi:MAG: hypothetical protein AB7E81_04370 [Hyphomicrobiaceae bacterium]|jgi:hypothetical protein